LTKAFFLVFDSSYQCKLVKKEIKAGRVIIDNGMYIVDETKPLLLKSGLFGGVKPLYLIKWNSSIASNPDTIPSSKPQNNVNNPYSNPKLKDGEAVKVNENPIGTAKPEFQNTGKFSPEMLQSLADMQVMRNLLGKSKSPAQGIILLMVGLFAGALVLYMLQYFKIM